MLCLETLRLVFLDGPVTKEQTSAPTTRTTITTRETVPKKTMEAGGSTSKGLSKSIIHINTLYSYFLRANLSEFSFHRCHSAHLNGLYYPRGHYSAWSDNGIVWFTWRGWWYSLKTSVMKIRLTDFQIDPIDGPKAVYPRPIS